MGPAFLGWKASRRHTTTRSRASAGRCARDRLDRYFFFVLLVTFFFAAAVFRPDRFFLPNAASHPSENFFVEPRRVIDTFSHLALTYVLPNPTHAAGATLIRSTLRALSTRNVRVRRPAGVPPLGGSWHAKACAPTNCPTPNPNSIALANHQPLW